MASRETGQAPRAAPAGLLNIHKPGGMTSRRVVDHVVRLVRPAKAGHAGTLDPLASGVLVVCVGAATRLIEYVQRMPKRYVGTFLLGRRSSTEDIEGEVELLPASRQPALDELRQAAARLTGEIEQRPPAYSALKVGGRRAYDLARAGRPVDLEPRRVRIDRLEVLRYEYPVLELAIECGGGTYIRSLGRDLAEAAGTSAVMSALVRTAIGNFDLVHSLPLEKLTGESLARCLLPPAKAVESLPAAELSADEAERIRHGQSIALPGAPRGAEVAALNAAGDLIAILRPRPDGGFGPAVNLLA